MIVKVKIVWPAREPPGMGYPVYIHYMKLRVWVESIGLECGKVFVWVDTGQYLPTYMMLDSESAMFYTLAVQSKTL